VTATLGRPGTKTFYGWVGRPAFHRGTQQLSDERGVDVFRGQALRQVQLPARFAFRKVDPEERDEYAMTVQFFEDPCADRWSAAHPLAAAPFGLIGELVGAHQAELAERKAEAEQLKAGTRVAAAADWKSQRARSPSLISLSSPFRSSNSARTEPTKP
jgi:hypothetical protein